MSRTRLLAIAGKEVIQLRRDPRSLALAFLLPVALLLLFGLAISWDIRDISTAVLDQDRSARSRELLRALESSGYFHIERMLARTADVDAALDPRGVQLVLVIPPDFSEDLGSGRPAQLQAIVDGGDANTATIILNYVRAVVQTHSIALVAARRTPGSSAAALGSVDSRVWYNEELRSRDMIVPGLVAVVMMIVAAMLTSLTIAREWERGTMEQLAATPVTRGEVILGKLLPYVAIGLFDVLISAATGVFLFGVPFRGSLALLVALSFFFLLGALGFGIFISAVAKSQVLATQMAMLTTFLPAYLLSGFMFAIEVMPKPLQLVTWIVPARYFLVVTRGIFLKGVGIEVLFVPGLLMVAFAAIGLTLAARVFRKELAMPSRERIHEMVRKEMLQLRRDPRLRRILFVAPVIQLIVFGYAVSTDVRNARVFVVDHDQTRTSRELVSTLTASGYFRVSGRSDRPADLVSALDHGRAVVGLEIPRGFARDLAGGTDPRVQIVVDGSNSNVATVALGYAERIVTAFVAREAGVSLGGVIDLRERAWFNPDLESRNYNVPGVMAVLVMLICLLLTSLAVVREREIGTLEQLMVSPLTKMELILGKAIPFGLIGLFDLVLVGVIAVLWFGVPFRGSLLVLFVASVLYIVCTLGIGLQLSTLSRTQQEAFLTTFLFFMPTFLLSGFVFPVTSMPAFFQVATLGNPVRHYLEIVRAVFLEGEGFRALWAQHVALLAMGIAVMALAANRFQKRLG